MAFLQTILAFGDVSWIDFLGAPRWALTVFREGGIRLVLVGGLAIAGSLAIASYCFAGAGRIRALPGQRAVLFAIAAALSLWGMRVFQLIAIEFSGAGSVRWQLFIIRGAPLVIGLLLFRAVSALGAKAAPALPGMKGDNTDTAATDDAGLRRPRV